MPTIEGRCHCGNLSYELETDRSLSELQPRECDCSFCRAHGAKCVSDPTGRARVRVLDPEKLVRYRFNLGSADFLVCAACGVYAGALMADDEGSYATLNLRMTAHHDVPGEPVSYGAEDLRGRRDRRRERWTPVELVLG